MGKKIFVSYKYSDSNVLRLNDVWGTTTARNYVDKLAIKLEEVGDHIYKGEDDGEDIGTLADSTISSKLGDKIFDSSVTIVLISKGMKENMPENDQWIPWEISYSLKEQTRIGRTSKTNAVLAVILPDENNSYEYFITEHSDCNCITYHTNNLFQMLSDNMFNLIDKESNVRYCDGIKIYEGSPSYIHSVKWSNFISNINFHIDISVQIKGIKEQYKIIKNIK
jgi:hypothetical protein